MITGYHMFFDSFCSHNLLILGVHLTSVGRHGCCGWIFFRHWT
ncbi:hypothetical protein HanXRQr2_Chr17g0800561 [Helianthus annuus]|uniref:Uncharacterized protein n=1 Tax=Helianthus annuus TaxID=4232 RepID=A0A9K3GTL0_HELAN|nr:hypothetical protein HanXRQr2_Chr17g0800561 [Helianthus annuus]KAJ0812982.1 hypothetical protein HanPSC8_Chr17g0768201 [Helianthus annuus]